MRKKREQIAYVLMVSVAEIEPKIWRRFIVPSSISLKKLHLVLQTVMGWSNYHLHQFETKQGTYGTPDPDYSAILDEVRIRLDRFLIREGDQILYAYDFGDGWVHELQLQQIIGPIEGDVTIECLDGGRTCPPEDVGGPHGYQEFLHAIRDRTHPEHANMLSWVGGKFDSEHFNAKAINRELVSGRRRA